MNENAERIRDLHVSQILLNKQKAEEASLAKSSFLAQMSHEIRTPMNVIKVLSELLLGTDMNKLQKDYANNIVNASSSLLNIINDILDFSKLDAQMFEIVNIPYDFPSLISDVSNIINLRALDKNITFITDIDGAIPSMLEGDDLRLKQILINLLQNAVKFTDKGHVKLSVKAEVLEDNCVNLVCQVFDTGIGIEEDKIKNLFEPFSQADLKKNHRIEGTGLGLSITKSLLDLMGGEISIESEYGLGSTFTFKVPQPISNPTPIAEIYLKEDKRILIAGSQFKIEAIAEIVHNLGLFYDLATTDEEFQRLLIQNKYTHLIYYYDTFHPLVTFNETLLKGVHQVAIKDIRFAGRQQTPDSASFLFEPVLSYELARIINYFDGYEKTEDDVKNKEIGCFSIVDSRVLIVDDNEVNLMVMQQLLKQYELEADLVTNGMEAIDSANKTAYDMIFMDHMMPIMNGVEATKKIRTQSVKNSNTPIIIVTANAIVGMREEYIKQGLDDYISKPIEIKELNTILNKWLPPEKIVLKGASENKETPTEFKNPDFESGMAALDLDYKQIYEDMRYDKDTYMAILDTFINSIPSALSKLSDSKKEKDYDSFRIHIHGIKSALSNIGAKTLSKSAQKLEIAAKESNYKYIDINFTEFSNAVTALVIGIESIMPEKEPFLRKSADPDSTVDCEFICSMLESVNEELNHLDSISAIEKLNELSAQLNQNQMDYLQVPISNILVSIENFDYDTASGIINEQIRLCKLQ